jgi:hypothetical protein
MDRLKIILNMLGRGAIYGAGLGALFGCAFGVPLIIFGGLVGILIGLGIGFGVGIVTGLSVGVITSLFFYPLKNIRYYRLSITLVCIILPAVLVPFIVQWAWFGHFTWNLPSAGIIFAFMAMIAGLVLSKWLIDWYFHRYH